MYKICNETNMEDIAKLEKEIFKFSGYSYKELCEMNQKKELYSFFSAKDEEDKMVGYIILFDNSDCLEIMKIGVLQEVRQRGIDSIMIDEVRKKDNQKNNSKQYKNIFFHCDISSDFLLQEQ